MKEKKKEPLELPIQLLEIRVKILLFVAVVLTLYLANLAADLLKMCGRKWLAISLSGSILDHVVGWLHL